MLTFRKFIAGAVLLSSMYVNTEYFSGPGDSMVVRVLIYVLAWSVYSLILGDD